MPDQSTGGNGGPHWLYQLSSFLGFAVAGMGFLQKCAAMFKKKEAPVQPVENGNPLEKLTALEQHVKDRDDEVNGRFDRLEKSLAENRAAQDRRLDAILMAIARLDGSQKPETSS